MNLEDWYKKTERTEERELRRKIRRDAFWRAAGDVAGGVLVFALYALLGFIFLAATPPQSSAINDLEEVGTEARP